MNSQTNPLIDSRFFFIIAGDRVACLFVNRLVMFTFHNWFRDMPHCLLKNEERFVDFSLCVKAEFQTNALA